MQGNTVSAYVNLMNKKETGQYILTIYVANEININVDVLFFEINTLLNNQNVINEVQKNLLYSIKLWPNAGYYYRHFLTFLEKYKYNFVIDDTKIYFTNDFRGSKAIRVVFRDKI